MFDEKALRYLFEQAETKTIEIGGKQYTTKPVHIVEPKMPAQIEVGTLAAVIDYLNSGLEVAEDVFVHIEDPTTVSVFSGHNEFGRRKHLVKATAYTGFMEFGRFMDMESFIIRLQAGFVNTEDRQAVIAYVANIDHEHKVKTTDNGLSQKAVVKVGIVDAEEVPVPNPVKLAPYRTFVEVEQPSTNFILRLRNEGKEAALFEADGGAWRLRAIENIKINLLHQLEQTEAFRKFKVTLLA